MKRQAELGGIKHALEDFTQRVSLPEASQLAGLLLRNTSLGTELVGSLAHQADHLRLARRQAALTQANKTPVKLLFPIMFCFAPAVLILLTAPAMMKLQDFLTASPMSEVIQKSMLSKKGGMTPRPVGPAGPSAATTAPRRRDKRPWDRSDRSDLTNKPPGPHTYERSNFRKRPAIAAALRSVHTANFGEILSELGISLLVSTYQAGKLVILRADGQGGVNTHFRGFNKPMGLAIGGNRLAIGTALEVLSSIMSPP